MVNEASRHGRYWGRTNGLCRVKVPGGALSCLRRIRPSGRFALPRKDSRISSLLIDSRQFPASCGRGVVATQARESDR